MPQRFNPTSDPILLYNNGEEVRALYSFGSTEHKFASYKVKFKRLYLSENIEHSWLNG
jgi:hypothetical protein